MKRIILIIPYFGKLPDYFQFFLDSCSYNPTIDFLLLTDDKTEYNYPTNFRVEYCTFDEIKKLVCNNFTFEVSLSYAFKMCDYRPAYGEIFHKYIVGYDFWGHCDIDLLFGDIRHFYTEDILERYLKVGHLGHLTLYRNTPYVNSLYKKSIKDEDNKTIEPYKIAYSCENGIGFDEWMFDNGLFKVNEIFMYYNEPVYYENHYSDLTPYTRPFIESYYDPYTKKRKSKPYYFYTWKSGKLYAHDYYGKTEERLYIHFLKRKMKVKEETGYINKPDIWLIIPNFICLGAEKPKLLDGAKVIAMNVLNPEGKKRMFWVMCGKVIKVLRKAGMWKKPEKK